MSKGITNNSTDVIATLMADLDFIQDKIGGLEWELFDDVPYSKSVDNKYRLMDTLLADYNEMNTPLEAYIKGNLGYNSMISGMAELMRESWITAKSISPRISNMFAGGNQDNKNFIYEMAQSYRDGNWVGWTAIGPGLGSGLTGE
jgi:hypothetical protein